MRHGLPVIRPFLPGLLAAFIVVLGLAGGPVAHAADLMRKQPYLVYPGDPTQMQVLWQLTDVAISTLEWGTDTTCAQGSVANAEYGDHQHAWTIEGLTPATKYHYRVTTDGVPYRGSFNTAPNAWATKLDFLAYGDTRTYPVTHNQVVARMLSDIAADSSFQSLVLFMGDYVTTGTNESYWTSEFFDPAILPNVRQLMANTAHQGTMGNHEGIGTLFVKYFPYPFVGGRYWSFDYGPIHVTVVDQYTSYGPGSAQLQWIANDLAGSKKTWKFIILHEPGWSAGGGHPNNTSVQSYLQPLCGQYGVSVVFAGHNHYYARAVVNGVQHLTLAGGGAPAYTPDMSQPYLVSAAQANHHATFAVDGDTLRFKVFNTAGGAVLDSFTAVRPSVTPDITFPTATVTSPAGGETWKAGSVQTITWAATDGDGVTTVDLLLSTDGGLTYPTAIARGLPNSGTRQWPVPNFPSTSLRVRAVAHDSTGNVGKGASAGDFTIDNWIIDASAGPGGSIIPSGAVPVVQTATRIFSIRPATGYRVGTLTVDGSPVTPDTTYRFSVVVAHHTIAATFVDTAGPVVRVTSPVGNEIWTRGTTRTITWTATDDSEVNRVDVDYSLTGPAGPWLPVGHELANSGSLPWTLPMQHSDSALVRVTAWDVLENPGSGTSDTLFHVYDPEAAVGEGTPTQLFLARPLPDPSVGSTRLRFGLPATGRVRLEIIDVAGRRVWHNEDDLPAGEHTWLWNGEADRGGHAGAGLFFVRLVTPSGTRTGRLVRLR